MDRCFNTSYVVIKLMDVSVYFVPDRRFNTSYVVIKLRRRNNQIIITRVSIHPMLLLNMEG